MQIKQLIRPKVIFKFKVRELRRKPLLDFLTLRQRYGGLISKADQTVLQSWMVDFTENSIPFFVTSGPLKGSMSQNCYTVLWKEDKAPEGVQVVPFKELEEYSAGRTCQCRAGCYHHGDDVCGDPVRPGNRFLCTACCQTQGDIVDSETPVKGHDICDIAPEVDSEL